MEVRAAGAREMESGAATPYYGELLTFDACVGRASTATDYFRTGTYSAGPAAPRLTSWVTQHSTSRLPAGWV